MHLASVIAAISCWRALHEQERDYLAFVGARLSFELFCFCVFLLCFLLDLLLVDYS